MGFLSKLRPGEVTGGNKAKRAAIAQSEKSTNEALGYVDDAWGYIDKSLSPVAEYGERNLRAIEGTPDLALEQFQFTPGDLQNDPGYQFRLSQGMEAMDRLYGKNRMLTSGNRTTGVTDYAQGLASQEYADAWRRAFDTTLANNQALTQGYVANMDRRKYLADTGLTAQGGLADYKYRTNVDKGNLKLGHAANTTAAEMFAGKVKADFINQSKEDIANITGAYLGGGMGMSDRRLKSSIVPAFNDGVYQWYSYDIGGRREIGVMAQEVMAINPAAVHEVCGWYAVDYGAL